MGQNCSCFKAAPPVQLGSQGCNKKDINESTAKQVKSSDAQKWLRLCRKGSVEDLKKLEFDIQTRFNQNLQQQAADGTAGDALHHVISGRRRDGRTVGTPEALSLVSNPRHDALTVSLLVTWCPGTGYIVHEVNRDYTRCLWNSKRI